MAEGLPVSGLYSRNRQRMIEPLGQRPRVGCPLIAKDITRGPSLHCALSCGHGGEQAPRAWGLGHLRWLRERYDLPPLEDQRLVVLGNRGVHHGAVAVAIDVGFPTLLVWAAPGHLAHLLAGDGPPREAVKRAPERANHSRLHKVQDQTSLGPEVNRQVEEVVFTRIALPVEHLQNHLPVVVVRQVPQHHRGTLVAMTGGVQSMDDVLSRFGLALLPDFLLSGSARVGAAAPGNGCTKYPPPAMGALKNSP
eukprot:CAMPEP_0177205302 /NCGR_PEP_ID=MMETSP0367-20130122/28794_1 /TAXON_ID=447022 ORGANISM="Scrippsiella hangoei-like, Strain SHHI-4" /NCGR_SAMPLE_ID=MMETSP0367 /ASSEMBLY_ACC=CAM_ASM_000362 /LENGTH=250 /DNA_ID=CAMNT_0018654027 /DNA_START=31 /DNA_END=781 /DNA_ORIENTATION=-